MFRDLVGSSLFSRLSKRIRFNNLCLAFKCCFYSLICSRTMLARNVMFESVGFRRIGFVFDARRPVAQSVVSQRGDRVVCRTVRRQHHMHIAEWLFAALALALAPIQGHRALLAGGRSRRAVQGFALLRDRQLFIPAARPMKGRRCKLL